MYARTYGETTCGVNGEQIIVEVDIANGLPAFEIVGLPDTAIKESRERVRAALKNSGFRFPTTRITVNLAPADLKKDGSGLDVPIAIGILCSSGQLAAEEIEERIFVGELALDGGIRGVTGVLPMIIEAKALGKKEIYIPTGNAAEGELVTGIDVYTPADLGQLVQHLSGRQRLPLLPKRTLQLDGRTTSDLDFADVQGQVVAKRALEIAAAGGHNVLMVGAPGAGKTMLARRLPSILPPMTEEEALEVTKIYSIAGLLPRQQGLVLERPFRSPHHTISPIALIGGGSIPKPGEVTLSHNGVLFLDELPEFSRTTLEVLRQPLEDGVVTISRVQASLSFPASFILVSAENPCPCGFFGSHDGVHECTCRASDILRYHKKISGPLLDRIDIQIQVPRLDYADMKCTLPTESSATIRARVTQARARQSLRLRGTGLHCNAELGHRELKQYCQLDAPAEQLLAKYFVKLGLSARSHDRIIKVAQTIADLEASPIITSSHLGEAIQLRTNINS
ncbi:MAG: YifB family Mg chelatase-like AAA ATPase [Acidaminococcaceae bacterium]